QNRDVESFVHGLELIQQKLLKALADEGITPFEALGKRFDPAYHEALAYHDNPEVPDQTVMEVIHDGYMINDRVLRAAQVVVAKGGPPRAEDEEPGTEDVEVPPQGPSSATGDQGSAADDSNQEA
ncbi:MAG: nucleotide exchange factor GrpE, partial [Planctomycetota bacterium]